MPHDSLRELTDGKHQDIDIRTSVVKFKWRIRGDT